LLNILKKQSRAYKMLSPELQKKIHDMKLNIIDNLEMPEYLRTLKNNRNLISSNEQKILFDNILEIIKNKPNNALNENDIKIQNGKLYLCGTMFYGDLLEESSRKRAHFLEPNNIIKD
jgi:hypothetical protein